jgi:peptidyl-prolyl cis-trans isomerase C
MNAMPVKTGGCGGGNCQCAGGAGEAQPAVPAINGITLHAPEEQLDPETLMERAWSELLRQEAVRQNRLPRVPLLVAPGVEAAAQQAIHAMLEDAVPLAAASQEECRRYYEANKPRFAEGQRAHVRHILFAVTDGVDVQALAARAEQALLKLTARGAPAGLFAQLARELSNCPSGADGGDLGWIGPQDCAEELAKELFYQQAATGLRPRLVHSRYGLHIVEVLAQEAGRELGYDAVRERIAAELAQRSRATALHQYIRVLAGQALVEGIDLEGATSPLVQ